MRNIISNQDLPITHTDNKQIVQVPARLTLLEAIAFRTFCSQLIENTVNQEIILDLSNTQFIDSSGIGALVRIYQLACQHHHQLVLLQAQPTVIKILEISGLIDIFQLQTALSLGLRTV